MRYGKDLLTKAVERAGSRYKLSQITAIPQSDLSDAWNGKRGVPASWVLRLARVAGVDPTEAMELHDLERSQAKKNPPLSWRLGVGGAAVLWLASWSASSEAAQAVQTVRGLLDTMCERLNAALFGRTRTSAL